MIMHNYDDSGHPEMAHLNTHHYKSLRRCPKCKVHTLIGMKKFGVAKPVKSKLWCEYCDYEEIIPFKEIANKYDSGPAPKHWGIAYGRRQ